MLNRRRFVAQAFTAGVTAGVAASVLPGGLALAEVAGGGSTLAGSTVGGPHVSFPVAARERIAVASYPFRNFIAGDMREAGPAAKIELKDFAAHVKARFNVNKIEPWTGHFPSTDPKYLEQFRASVAKAGGFIVNIAVDGEASPYAADRAEREKAVAYSKSWADAAKALGSPSIRTNIPAAKDSKPDLGRAAESLARVAEYAASRNVVVHLENDNPESENPFFLVQLIEKVNSPWLHALPDFANSLAGGIPNAYEGIDGMFGKAYGICHVKAGEADSAGKMVSVDMAKTFGYLKAHSYAGYCSMEFDSEGDPYSGTASLIETTLKYLG
jgi:sugar phosphate isomerase/epimerase